MARLRRLSYTSPLQLLSEKFHVDPQLLKLLNPGKRFDRAQAALEKLADADIVMVQGLPPESDYRFKHALIQDAAYENLLKSRRQLLHRRVAQILHDRFADTPSEPEVLAHHFTQAGIAEAASE